MGSPDDNPGLWTAEKLIARKEREIHARRNALLHQRFRLQTEPLDGQQAATAEVVEKQEVATVCEASQFAKLGEGREAGDAKVARMNPQQGHSRLADCLLEIAKIGAVGRADLNQLGAALSHHVGNPEAAANL